MPTPIVLSWSSGKDSAWALHRLREGGQYEVVALLSTVNAANDRVSMHGTSSEILAAVAYAVGTPLIKSPIAPTCTNAEYEKAFLASLAEIGAQGNVRTVAFGDLFLEDVRAYREALCKRAGWNTVYPLWGIPTADLAGEMVAGGAAAKVSCVDTRVMPIELLGRDYDQALLEVLPPGVDPCAENGEFHTIATDGPAFFRPVPLGFSGIVRSGDFAFADLRLI